MKLMTVSALTLATVLALPNAFASNTSTLFQTIMSNNPTLNPTVVKEALNGYEWAVQNNKVKNKNYLTIINFNEPSNKKRLNLIDLQTGKVVMNLLVAQGKNSGHGLYATKFSNQHYSDETSLGVYTTANTYKGKHGVSLRLNGLEKGINNNALVRDVVIHPAVYATPTFLKAHGYLGHSWGCFAINPKISKQFINYTKGSSVIFAYATPENHDSVVDSSVQAI